MRYERKIPVYGFEESVIRGYIRLHPAGFREIHETRMVNNIYFDSPSLDCGLANVEGHRERLKFRIRWYGCFAGKIDAPRLELKIKQDHLGAKQAFNLNSFHAGEHVNSKMIGDLIRQSPMPETIIRSLKPMKPVLVNSYTRTYFLSSDRCYRLTLDTDLMWGNVPDSSHSRLRLQKEDQAMVLEVKYEKEYDDGAAAVTSRFPWRVSKNSKYMNALCRLY